MHAVTHTVTCSPVRVLVSTPQGMAGSFLSLEGLSLSTVPEKMSRVFFAHASHAAGDRVAARDAFVRYLALEPEGRHAPRIRALLARLRP